MKIALFVTGHLRNTPKIRDNFIQFLNGHDTDVFVATWSSYDLHRGTHQPIFRADFNVDRDLDTMFGSALKGKWVGDILQFERDEIIPRRLRWNAFIPKESDPLNHIAPWPERVMDQWYVVKRAYELCSNPDAYEVAIRIRGDMTFTGKPPVPFGSIEDGIHVNGYCWWTQPQDRENGTLIDGTGLIPYALSDQLAWGKPYWMKKYFEYYDHFGPLYAGRINWEGRDGTARKPGTFLFNSEHMMAYYLLKYPYYRYPTILDSDLPVYRHGHDMKIDQTGGKYNIYADYYDLLKEPGTY